MSEKSSSRPGAGKSEVCSVRRCSRKRKYVKTGWCQTHYHRWWRTETTELLPKQVRTDLTYYGAHGRIKMYWGSASQYFCIECGEQAAEWAYDGTDPSELEGEVKVDGVKYPVRYSVWPEFYAPLCTGCHRAKDRSAWSLRRTHCKNGHEMTKENTYTRPSRPNTKECRTCRAENSKARYFKRKVPNHE